MKKNEFVKELNRRIHVYTQELIDGCCDCMETDGGCCEEHAEKLIALTLNPKLIEQYERELREQSRGQ